MTIKYKNIFLFILIYVVTVPVFENYIGSIGNMLINGVVLILALSFILILNKRIYVNIKEDAKLRILIYIISSYFLIISFASINGIIFSDVNPIMRDVFEFHKPVLYFSLILSSYYILSQNKNFYSMSKYLNIIFCLIFVISIFQLSMNREVTLMYTANNIFESKRLTIPFGNPYDYGFVMIFFSFYFFFKYISGKLLYAIPFTISVYLFLQTGSRSVFLSFVIVSIFFIPLIIFFSKYSIKQKIFIFFQLIFPIVLIYIFLDIDAFYKRYIFLLEQFVQFYTDNQIGDSAETRLEQFLYAFRLAMDNPLVMLFGNGPAKSIIDYSIDGNILYMEHVESAQTYLLYRYGLLGIFCFSLLYLITIFTLIQNIYLTYSNKEIYALNNAILCWILTIPFSSIGGMYIEQPRVSVIFYVLISYSFAINYIYRNKKTII